MADGNLGSLFMSLDIKDETESKLNKVLQNIADIDKRINSLQKSINDSSKELNKLSEGSSAWRAQRDNIKGMVSEVNNLVGSLGVYQKELVSLNQKMSAIDAGKLVLPHKTITSYLDTKPIEAQIQKLEKYEQILKHIQDLQGKKNDISLDAQTGLGGTHAWDVYQKRIQEVDEQIARAKVSLQEIGGGNMNLGSVRSQLDSLYGTLERFENANKNATTSIRDNRSELEKHRAKQKEVEAAFAPLLAAQQREAKQEAANRANIEATNAARQKQVQVLREQSEAMMRSKLSELQSNRAQMARLYSTGRSIGLSEEELVNIRRRYQEISREIMTMQTLLQNSKGLSYNEMFSFGRNSGPSGGYVREAANSISRAKQETERLKQETESSARAARELASAFRQAQDATGKTSQIVGDLKSMLLQGGLVYGMQQFAMSIIQTGGEIEKQHIALQSILGDLQNANELFGQIKNLAIESPFTFSELNRDVKQLAAFGVETDQLYDKTKRIADISAGLGVSFERLGLAYGQIKSRSWLDGKELRQLAYAGLPMLQKLADMYTRERGKAFTTRDVRTMISKREVSFEDVDKIFDELTNKGGQFYQMQNTLSDTLLGRYLKLKDAWEIMLSGFARGDSVVGGTMKHILNSVTALVQGFDKLGPVILAAFSGVALKKVGFAIGGGTAASILQAKGVLAAKYQEKALSGQLEATERRILATKHLITTEDLKALAASGAITNKEAQRLLLSNKITASQYAQLGVLTGSSVKINAITVRMRALNMAVANGSASAWQSFALRGLSAINMVAGGIKSIGVSLWSAIGGLPGLILTGVTMGLVHLWQKSEELKQAQKQAMDELTDRAKQLKEFLADNDIKKTIGNGGQDLINSIDAYKEKLKELAPYNYEAYVMQMEEKASHEERLKYLRKELELLKDANTVSTRKSDKFIDNFGGRFEDIGDNIKGLQQAVDDSGKSQMAKQMFREYRRIIDSEIKDIAEDILKEFPDIATNPKTQEAFKQLRANLYSAKNFTPDQQMYIDIKLDELLHIKDDSRFKTMVQDELLSIVNESKITLSNGVEETGAMLAEKIKYGQKLTDAEKKKLDELLHIAISKLKADYPEYASTLQHLLNNTDFVASVKLNFVGEKPTGLQKQIYNNFPSISNQKVRNLGTSWMGENQSIDEAVNKGKQEINKRLNEFLSRKNAFAKGKITKDELSKSEIDYNNSVSALQLGYGVTYKGENTGLNKKFQQQQEKAKRAAEKAKRDAERAAEKARREEERRQREILRSWQSRKKLLEEYYETWNKWRNIEGKEDAKARLRNDKRFGSISKTYTDPEKLAGNLSKLVEGYKKLAKTEDQRNFLAEARTEAAKKEADLEFINAERLVKSLNEQLNLLSKQYDIYQKLSKFTTSAAAAEYAFGSYNVSRAGKGSYYGYLHDTLNSLQGKKVTPKAFVDNSMPDGDKDKMELDNVLVTASTKRADFGPNGLEGVLAMTDADIEEKFGKESRLVKILIDYKKERASLDSEIAEDLSKGYEFEDDYAAQIEFNNRRLDEQIERLRERNKLSGDHPQHISNDTLAEAELNLRKKTTRENNDLSFKQMQKDTGWSVALGNLGAMSSGVVDRIKREIETRLDVGNLSDDERSKLNEALTKLNEQFEKSDPFSAIVKGYDIVKAIDSIRNGSKDKNGQYTIDAQKARSVGLKVSKDNKYSDADLDEAQANVFKGFDTSIKAIADEFQSLQTVLQPVVELFDSLGNKGIGEGAQIAGKAVNSGMNVAGGIKNLQNLVGPDTGLGQTLGKAGPYGAAAAAALSVFSSLWNKKTASQKAYEKQAEYLKNIQGAVKEINGSLKEKVSSSFGSQAQSIGSQVRKNLDMEADEVRNTYLSWSNAKEKRGGNRNRVKLFGFADKVNQWLNEIGWNHRGKKGEYIETVGAQELHLLDGKLLERYRNEHAGTWATIDSTAKEYLNRLIEIEGEEGEVKKITDDIAKALTDMDLSSLKSEWVDLLNNLDSANEDFADNFEKHMRNAILNGMVANQYRDKLAELNKENAKRGGSEKGNKYIDKNGNVKEHTGGDDSKDVLSEYTEEEYRLSAEAYKELSEQARQTRDVLKKIYGWSDKDSKSRAGSNIKGITENTADILASYLNQCRADLSVVRNLQATHLPQLSEVAKSQLAQLSMISQHTLRNAEAAERIDDSVTELSNNIRQVINGTKQIHVK